MNEERLQEIEARASMATGGPWESGRFDCLVEIPARGYSVCMTLSERNAAFIAHAREDVPALVAEVRALRAELNEARELIEQGLTARTIQDLRAELAQVKDEREILAEELARHSNFTTRFWLEEAAESAAKIKASMRGYV